MLPSLLFNFLFFLVVFLLQIQYCNGGIVDPVIGCTPGLNPSSNLCSSHGRCVVLGDMNETKITQSAIPNTMCICDEGWTGLADLLNLQHHDCHINIKVIKAFWSIVVIVTFLEFLLVIKKLYQSWKRLQEVLNANKNMSSFEGESRTGDPSSQNHNSKTEDSKFWEQWKIAKNFLNWNVVTMALLALPHTICLILIGLLRLSDFWRFYIGFDILTSFIYAAQEQFAFLALRKFSLAWLNVRGKILKFSAENNQASKTALKRYKRVVYAMYGGDIIRILSIILIPFLPQHQNILILIWLNVLGIMTIISAVATMRTGRTIEAILLKGIEHISGKAKEEREEAARKIRWVSVQARKSIIILGIPDLLLGWWPWLRWKSGYLVIQVCIAPVILMERLNILLPPPIIAHGLNSKTNNNNSNSAVGPIPQTPQKVKKELSTFGSHSGERCDRDGIELVIPTPSKNLIMIEEGKEPPSKLINNLPESTHSNYSNNRTPTPSSKSSDPLDTLIPLKDNNTTSSSILPFIFNPFTPVSHTSSATSSSHHSSGGASAASSYIHDHSSNHSAASSFIQEYEPGERRRDTSDA